MVKKDFEETSLKYGQKLNGSLEASVLAALESYYQNLSWLMHDLESISSTTDLSSFKDVYQALTEMQSASESVVKTIESRLEMFEKNF